MAFTLWSTLRVALGETAALAALSPCGLLALWTLLAAGHAAPLSAVELLWRMASIHGTLPFAFACISVFPFCTAAASVRVHRLLCVHRQAC